MQPKLILVLCEGDTEYHFLNSVNRFCRDNARSELFTFVRENLGGVNLNNFVQKINYALRKHEGHFHKLCIWLDFDIFKRANPDKNDKDIADMYTRILLENIKLHRGIVLEDGEIAVCFNYMNGEDFILSCFTEDIFSAWYKFCLNNNHFISPMVASVYKEEILKFVPIYNDTLALREYIGSATAVDNLLKNATQCPVFGFAEIIRYIVENMR